LSQSLNATTYAIATSGGSTETLNLSANIGLSGSEYNDLNQLTSSAAGGTVTIEGSTNRAVQPVQINSNPATMNSTTQFSGTATVTAGTNSVEITATTGNTSSTTTNTYQLTVSGGASQSFTYDANGNMTSDGTRTFTWDAENRLLQITYPGTGNSTQFAYDGLGKCVQIVETTNGTVTSTKQFIWCGNSRCEVRDGSGNLLNQYFALGQVNFSGGTGTNYFYTKDHLGSIREMTDSSGTIQAQYAYSPWGEVTKLQGSLDSDFGFTGAYRHQRSGLNLTMYRAYNPALGRWLSRDPLGQSAGTNLYGYVMNNPISRIDPLGLEPTVTVSGNNVNIDLPVQFYGPGTQLGVNGTLIQGINSAWTGQIGQYNVTMNAHEVTSGDYTSIYLGGQGGDLSTIIGGDYAVWPLTGIQNQVETYGITPGQIAGHEVGHTMGLYDAYNQQGLMHVPNPGHGNDIMGNPAGKPTPQEIDYLINRWAKPKPGSACKLRS
jgi:RHS repeat-associated protein